MFKKLTHYVFIYFMFSNTILNAVNTATQYYNYYLSSTQESGKPEKPAKASKHKDRTLQDYHYVFHTRIFDHYQQQLSTFALQELSTTSLKDVKEEEAPPLAKKALKFLSLLQIQSATPKDKQLLHEKIIDGLRELIKEKEIYKTDVNYITTDAIQLIDKINVWMYSAAEQLPAMLEMLRVIDPNAFNEDVVENSSLVKLISEIQCSFADNPTINGALHPHPNQRDLHKDGYIPTYLYEAFSTPFIMTPRVTIEDKEKQTVEINPEFINYLRCLKAKGQTHLYVNLMKRADKDDKPLNERQISLPIEALAQSEEFKGVLTVVTLDKSRDFYWQKSPYDRSERAIDFKLGYLEQLFEPNEKEARYKWPESFDKGVWRNKCSAILDSIHQRYFENKDTLTPEEKGEFIELSYAVFIRTLCEDLKPTRANISCKYTKDRGPSLLAFFYAYSLAESKTPLTKEHKLKILTILFAPPLMIENNKPHTQKLDRFAAAIMRLNVGQPSESADRALFASFALQKDWKVVKLSSKSAMNGLPFFAGLIARIRNVVRRVFKFFGEALTVCVKGFKKVIQRTTGTARTAGTTG